MISSLCSTTGVVTVHRGMTHPSETHPPWRAKGGARCPPTQAPLSRDIPLVVGPAQAGAAAQAGAGSSIKQAAV